MLSTLYFLQGIIDTHVPQQIALSVLVMGTCGLGLLGTVIHLVSKIKAVAFFGG